MGRPWTVSEDQFIRDNIGTMTSKDMANEIGRSHGATRVHIHEMRSAGTLPWHAERMFPVEYVSDLHTCAKCGKRRTSTDREGVCKVCRAKGRLKAHTLKMHAAYANLPRELKDRTNGSFRIKRNKALMTKSRNLSMPQRPNTDGMTDFEAASAMDEWLVSVEKYEMATVQLDIDATKQRTSKWGRKARAYRAKKGKTK